MNYLILKSIIEATIANFICKNCQSRITDQDISVLGSAGNSINLEIICPSCKMSGVVKAEVAMMPPHLNNSQIMQNVKNIIDTVNREGKIKADDISKLKKDIEGASTAEDLFR